jgi:hypothetical protein
MHNIRIIETIIRDLKKIEYALRVETIDISLLNKIHILIIEIYKSFIINNSCIDTINSDVLSDLYFITNEYQKYIKIEQTEIITDIIRRMQIAIKT